MRLREAQRIVGPVRRLVDILDRVDHRLLVTAGVLFCAVCFAAFKAIGAWTKTDDTPEYRNHPAKAFVPPASERLVETQYLTQKRLFDSDYNDIARIAEPLIPAVGRLRASAATLQTAGMSKDLAASTARQLNAQRTQLATRDAQIAEDYQLVPGSNASTAQLTATINYSAARDGSPPVSGTINLSFSKSGGRWALDAASLSVEDAASFDSGE